MEKYVCSVCGYAYDPAKGEPSGKISRKILSVRSAGLARISLRKPELVIFAAI